MENKRNTGFLILLAVIIILQVIIIKKMNNNYNNIQQIRNEIASVRNDVNNINYSIRDISSDVADELKKQYSVISNVDWTSKYTNDVIEIHCNVNLNKELPDAEVWLYYKEEIQKNWMKIQMKRGNGLEYSTDLQPDTTKKYVYQISIPGENGETSDIRDIPERLYSYQKFEFNKTEISYNRENEISSYTIIVAPYTKTTIPELNAVKIECKLMSGNECLDTLNLLENIEKFQTDYENDKKLEHVSEDKFENLEQKKMLMMVAGEARQEIIVENYDKPITDVIGVITYGDGKVLEQSIIID